MSLHPTPDAATLRQLAAERAARRATSRQAAPEARALTLPLTGGDRAAEPKQGRKASGQRGAKAAPKRRKAPPPLEHEEQVALFALIDTYTPRYPDLACVYAVPNFAGRMGKLTARHGAALKREGRRKGYPDVNVDVPRGGCPGLRLELKRLNATPSDVAPEQRDWHRRLRAQGYRVEVCRGHAEAWAVLCEYLGIPNLLRNDAAA